MPRDIEFDTDALDLAMTNVQNARLAHLISPPDDEFDIGDPNPEPVDDEVDNTGGNDADDPDIPTPDVPAPDENVPVARKITINGKEYDEETLESLASFEDMLRANPAMFATIENALKPQPTQPVFNPNVQTPVIEPVDNTLTPPEPFVLPDDLDLEDPNTKFLVESMKSLRQQQDILLQQNQQFNQHFAAQQTQSANQQIIAGEATFRLQNPDITEEELTTIRTEIGNTNLLNTLVSKGIDIQTATTESLNRTMWTIPEIRTKFLAGKEVINLQETKEEKARQRKLNSISGTSSSTPRVPTPQTKPDKRSAMINDIAQAMGQRAGNN